MELECRDLPTRDFMPGEVVVEEGKKSGHLYFLKSGSLEISRDGVAIAELSEPGTVIGEISILLDRPHTAHVVASVPSVLYFVEDVDGFLRDHPEVNLFISRSLARRVDALTCYVVDLKQQFAEEEGHLGMVHEVLDSLLHARH